MLKSFCEFGLKKYTMRNIDERYIYISFFDLIQSEFYFHKYEF